MPFTKVRKNDYTSPSGRHFTEEQVKAYYATNGFGEGIDETAKKEKKNVVQKRSSKDRKEGRRK